MLNETSDLKLAKKNLFLRLKFTLRASQREAPLSFKLNCRSPRSSFLFLLILLPPTQGVKKAMTQINEVDSLKSQSHLVSNSSISLNSQDLPNPKDELLKSDMMKKLSLKEKWLNEQAAAKAAPMEVDRNVSDGKKKDEKKSFFTGIFTSVKQLIKHDKPDKTDKHKSMSPPSGESVDLDKLIADEKIDVDNFDELVVESDKPVPGCVNKRIQAFLQKQKSEEVREEADDILNNIKEGNDRMAKQMRDMEQKRFSDNMKAIKSSVVDSKVASMKEVNLSKYFPSQQEKKPPAVAKNRDVKALKDVNLSKYFPQASPTTGKKIPGSPTGPSATSSAAASPLTPRKDVNEIDLANYFPGTPVLSRKTSVSTPPSSPMTETAPPFERRFSITNSIPPPPPPPVAKKNVLALQSVKKRQPSNENVDTNVVKKEKSPVKSTKKKLSSKDDFNMFDQLLDGAIDLKEVEEKLEVDLDSFESLIDEVKLERSPSKEYAKIVDDKSRSGSKKTPENVEMANGKKISPEPNDEVKKTVKKKRKSPKKVEKPEILDKLVFDPEIYQSLTSEYQRLLGELVKSEEFAKPKILSEIEEESSPTPSRLDNKRKSPPRSFGCKKFKEEMEEAEPQPEVLEIEDESVAARLERKYRRGSIRSIEETPQNEAATPPTPNADEKPSDQPYSIIERLERKLKQRRESDLIDNEQEVIKEPPKLSSVSLVKDQCQQQEVKQSKAELKLDIKQSKAELKLDIKPETNPKIKAEVRLEAKPDVKQSKSEVKETKPQTEIKLDTKPPQSPKKQEVNCFDNILSLPRDSIGDIFTELEMTENETEKALKEFQESFDMLAQEEAEASPALEAILSLPKENDFDFNFAINDPPAVNAPTEASPKVSKRKSKKKAQPLDIQIESEAAAYGHDAKQKRNSLQMDLAEIDFGISERPLNFDNLFPRRRSIEESIGVPDSPNSLTSNDDLKINSGKDSAYSGSRKSSLAHEFPPQQTKPAVAASYMNVLKEISSGLIGFDDEPLMLMETPVAQPMRAQLTTEPPPRERNAKENYTKVLQDISSTLVGLDLHEEEPRKKNYSQMIPPFVQDPIPLKKVPSANILELPNGERVHECHSDVDEVIDIKVPVPPIRRHRSVESSEAAEPTTRTRRLLPTSKSFDYETISGRTSKNSTEYYDHYYPTAAANTARRTEKYETNARKDSLDGGLRIKTRQRAIDDLMVKSAATRLYEPDDVPVRRYDYRREESEPADANILLERSQMLHRRKESFMRDQMTESSNPYIREMMKQDVDNPIDISDIKFIRKHPTAPLPTSHVSAYQRPAAYVPSVSTRTPITYGKSSHTPITTSSYSRPSAVTSVPSYKSSVPSSSYLKPSSSTAAHILTKSHALSPHSSHSSSYTSRQRPVTSLSDAHTRTTSHSRPTSYSQQKSSGSSRDACVVS